MGGALILVSIAITTLLWGDLANRFVWVVLLVTLGFGAIGWVDDWRKVVTAIPRGFGAREVLLAVGDRPRRRDLPRVLGLGAGQRAVRPAALRVGAKRLQRRAAAEDRPDRAVLQDDHVSRSGVWASSRSLFRDRRHQQRGEPHRRPRRPRDHADGDGRRRARLFAYVAGNASSRATSASLYIPGAGELAVFCGAMAGAGLGFLWFNAYPGRGLHGRRRRAGARRGARHVAVIVRQEIVLFIMGGVFVVETLSVIIQVARSS